MSEPETPSAPSLNTRIDGWTVQMQADFIACLVESGSVKDAAKRVGMHVTSAYRCRARHPAFAEAWDSARQLAYVRLQDEAIDRAINGTPREVWHAGEKLGTGRVWNDKLLMQMIVQLRDHPPKVESWADQMRVPQRTDATRLGTALNALDAPPVERKPANFSPPRTRAPKAPAAKTPAAPEPTPEPAPETGPRVRFPTL